MSASTISLAQSESASTKRKQMKVKIARDTTDATIQTNTPPQAATTTSATPTMLMYQRSIEEVVTTTTTTTTIPSAGQVNEAPYMKAKNATLPPQIQQKSAQHQQVSWSKEVQNGHDDRDDNYTSGRRDWTQTHSQTAMKTTTATATSTTVEEIHNGAHSSLALTTVESTTNGSAQQQGAADRKQVVAAAAPATGGERRSFSALPCKLKVHIKIAPDSKTKNISSSSDISDNTKLTITTVSNTQVSNGGVSLPNTETVQDPNADVDDEDDDDVVVVTEEVIEPQPANVTTDASVVLVTTAITHDTATATTTTVVAPLDTPTPSSSNTPAQAAITDTPQQ